MKKRSPGILERSPGLSEIKVSYTLKFSEMVQVTNSTTAFKVLFNLFDKSTICLKEDFFILLLNRANRLLGWFRLSSGGTSGTIVDVKLIFMLALKTNSSSIIMCHNHPSGNLSPSTNDIDITSRVKQAGKLLDISLIDHLIISPDERFNSMADCGLV